MKNHEALKFKLFDEFERRRQKNSSYSLRAFAKSLNINHSALSEILSGKRTLTRKNAEKFCDRLFLDPKEKQSFLESENEGENEKQSSPKTSLELAVDHYRLISDWFCFAILSFGELYSGRVTTKKIKNYFGLKESTIEQALDRLERTGLIHRRNSHYEVTGKSFQSPLDNSSPAFKKNQLQSLQIAEQSLQNDSTDINDFCSITMAIDPDKLPEAKRRIRQFRDELCDYLEAENKKEVYRMNIQLVPLKEKGEGNV